MSETETSSAVLSNAYTHLPKLHANLFLSGLQLFSWFLLHPSAWRNHLSGIAPSLRPNFSLTELSWEQWRDPAIRRLLITLYVGAPLVSGALAGLIQLILWANRDTTLSNMAWAVWFCLITSLVVGVIVSVPAGVTGGMVCALSLLLAYLYLTDRITSLVYNIVMSVTPVLALIIRSRWPRDQWQFIVAVGILLCAARFAPVYLDHNWIAKNVIQIFAPHIQSRLETLLPDIFDNALWGISDAMRMGFLFIIFYVIAERASNARVGAIASIIVNSALLLNIGLIKVARIAIQPDMETSWPLPLLALAVILGATSSWWAPVGLYPFYALWNLLLYRADLRRPADRALLFRWHSAFWDETQRLRSTHRSKGR